MRCSLALLPLLVAACAAPPPPTIEQSARPVELDGRTAGTAQRCIAIQPGVALRLAEGDRHMLLYGYGSTIWANPLPRGCGFTTGDTLIAQPIGASHCRGDRVRSIDPVSGVPSNACDLGNFIPYLR